MMAEKIQNEMQNEEYDSSNNELDRQSQIAIAALGNESVSDTNKVGFIKNLGELAFKVWANK